jgi:hypothetical protein
MPIYCLYTVKSVSRTSSIFSYQLIPCVAAEPFTRVSTTKWSTTDYAGCLLPVGKHVQFNAYYGHENDTGESPNRQENFVGMVLDLYFSLKTNSQSPATRRK